MVLRSVHLLYTNNLRYAPRTSCDQYHGKARKNDTNLYQVKKRMKIIAIDAGNTHIRLAVVDVNTPELYSAIHFRLDHSKEEFRSIFQREGFDIPVAIASVVHSAIERLVELLKSVGHSGERIICDHRESTLLQNLYSETLGIDRYVDGVAGIQRFPNQDLIVIDSGTATTVDFIRKDRLFLGGFILPGIGLKARAIGQWTDKLPLLNPYELAMQESPKTTIEAVSSGLLVDCAGGIEKAIAIGQRQLTSPLIIACGGGWEIIGSYVSEKIIAMPDLTLFGTALVGHELLKKRRPL